MADQTVRIANIPDSGSPERVAFELANMVRSKWENEETRDRAAFLDLYAECLHATRGYRKFD